MTNKIYFISRHKGAIEWIQDQRIAVTDFIEHLSSDHELHQNDTVIGTLPISIISHLNAQGIRYLHLDLTLTPEMRGKELTKNDMYMAKASLKEYLVKAL